MLSKKKKKKWDKTFLSDCNHKKKKKVCVGIKPKKEHAIKKKTGYD